MVAFFNSVRKVVMYIIPFFCLRRELVLSFGHPLEVLKLLCVFHDCSLRDGPVPGKSTKVPFGP